MADLNSTVRLWNANGGRIWIGARSTGDRIRNVVPGSLVIRHGMRTPEEYIEDGIVQTPKVGSQTYGEVEFRIKAGSLNAATDPWELFQVASSTDTVPVFTLTLDLPNFPGATAGQVCGIANCFLAQPSELNTSDQGEITLRFRTPTQDFSWTTY